MRILDEDRDQAVENVTIYLTPSEAQQLLGFMQSLLNNQGEHHVHISDSEYRREVTIAIYTNENLSEFDERSRRLIQED